MTAVDDGSSTNSSRKGLTSPPAVGGAEQKSNIPRTRLKRPLTREDIPHAQSTVKLFKGLMNGTFTERQRHCIAKDVAVGPIYEAVMDECEKWGEKPMKFSLCCQRRVCPTQVEEFFACIRSTGDASVCHEFRDEVERCGARMSQRILRAALSDEWF